MVPQQYLNKVRGILDHLEQTQMPALAQAAELIVQALTHQGLVYCSELGHGIQGDFLGRAGGLAVIQPFNYTVNVTSPVPRCYQNRPRPDTWEQDLETVR
ncbi:MAG: SIS domain-containing protein, partial [Kiritimatiellia bacterium]|nr:SIS domain-containing protein [Kiritimatiellia bacterium]